MIAELAAVQALLTPLGHPVYDVDATGAAGYPRLVLWSAPGRMAGDTLDDVRADVDGLVYVTVAALTPAAVRIIQAQVRTALTPTGTARDLTVAGRAAWLLHFDSTEVEIDREVLDPATNTHPAFAVEVFQLISTPA